MPTLYAMQQRTLPPRTELGLRLDPTTHEIAGVLPGSAADACGISEGDILVGINDTMVVNFEYAPGPAEGTILVGRTSASADSNAVLASAQAAGADLVLNILKPMDAGARPPNAAAATLMRAPPTASRQQQPQGNGVWSAANGWQFNAAGAQAWLQSNGHGDKCLHAMLLSGAPKQAFKARAAHVR